MKNDTKNFDILFIAIKSVKYLHHETLLKFTEKKSAFALFNLSNYSEMLVTMVA